MSDPTGLSSENGPAFDAALPLVTIVIVNHNYCEFVEQCIQSADLQDYPRLECIVLDCASTDNSVPVIEAALARITRGGFRLLKNSSNHNHLINSLSVLNEVRGVFVVYLDADDIIFPQFVSTHVAAHLNNLRAAAISVTDQVQIDDAGQLLAGTCHWHQKWRRKARPSDFIDLARPLSWNLRHKRMEPVGWTLHYVPPWWSSWIMERWIWSTTSALMFRRSVIESLAPSPEDSKKLEGQLGFDGYFARLAHSVGGTLLIGSTEGAYRRHGRNLWSSNPVLGGQTPNGSRDEVGRFRNSRQIARNSLVTGRQSLLKLLGSELYYSIVYQLMSTSEFVIFAIRHRQYRYLWRALARSLLHRARDLVSRPRPR